MLRSCLKVESTRKSFHIACRIAVVRIEARSVGFPRVCFLRSAYARYSTSLNILDSNPSPRRFAMKLPPLTAVDSLLNLLMFAAKGRLLPSPTRQRQTAAWFVCFVWSVTWFSGLARGEESRRPDVLFIAVDDLNVWLSHLGGHPQAKTPNIDRLARMGLTCERAYCAAPACEPSRAALMSGQRPWTTGCYVNGDTWKNFLKPGEGLSAQFLKAGYHVAGAGKIYHGDQFFEAEWTEYQPLNDGLAHGKGVDKHEAYYTPLVHDLQDTDLGDWKTVDFCIERLNSKSDKPLFLACGLHKPHLPFVVPKKYYDMFPLESIILPPHREDDLDDIPPAGVKMAKPDADHAKLVASGRWKAAVQSYLAAGAYTDMNIGRLLDALDKSDRKGNTIIVFWGDHGWSLGEKSHWRKFALWEEPTRAPLIWVAPGVTKPGSRCQQPVDFMSIYPTLCELAGLEVPKQCDGPSMVSLLKDPASNWSVPAITTHGYENHGVRTIDYRYIRYADGSEELYDHRNDPHEWTNLAKHTDMAEQLARHRAMLPKNAASPGKVKVKKKD